MCTVECKTWAEGFVSTVVTVPDKTRVQYLAGIIRANLTCEVSTSTHKIVLYKSGKGDFCKEVCGIFALEKILVHHTSS